MSINDQGPQNVAQAEAEALRALEAGAWRVWRAGSGPLPAAYARWCGAEVERATAGLRNRAEAAEAEVARLKALLSSQGTQNAAQAEAHAESLKQHYTPRVGDVCVVTVDRACDSPLMRGDVVTITGEVGVDSLWVRKVGGDSWLVGPNKIRPANAEERAAAGLPPAPVDAPAAPRVLPEHLAYLEADAARYAQDYNHPVNGLEPQMVAARALVAAVARRDGGAR